MLGFGPLGSGAIAGYEDQRTVLTGSPCVQAAVSGTGAITQRVRGDLAWIEANDTCLMTSNLLITLALSWSDAPDTMYISVDVSGAQVTCTLNWTEPDDSFLLVAGIPASGTLAWLEANDQFNMAAYIDNGFLDPNPNNLYIGPPRVRRYTTPLPKD